MVKLSSNLGVLFINFNLLKNLGDTATDIATRETAFMVHLTDVILSNTDLLLGMSFKQRILRAENTKRTGNFTKPLSTR